MRSVWKAVAFCLLIVTQLLQAQSPPAGSAPIAVIRLHGPVDAVMFSSFQRRVEEARAAGCQKLVLELHTNGGLLDTALDMSRWIKSLPLPTVAYINTKAFSAGTIIALACKQTIMAPHASIGDCAPIAIFAGSVSAIAPDLKAKVTSPLLQDMEESAGAHQPPIEPLLVRAMVLPELRVEEVKNSLTGQTRFVDGPTAEKLLTSPTTAPTQSETPPWQKVRTLDDENSLLTLGTLDAMKTGFASGSCADLSDLNRQLGGHGEPLVLEFSAAERLTQFLTETWVRAILFFLMVVFFWGEWSHPGISIFGLSAAVCLGLLIGAPYLTGLAQTWQIALIVTGVLLALLDMVLHAGMGPLMALAIMTILVGIVASFVPAEPGNPLIPQRPESWHALKVGLSVVFGGSLAAFAVIGLLVRWLGTTKRQSPLQLTPAIPQEPAPMRVDHIQARAGQQGTALSPLRPAGKATIEGHVLDVVTLGEFIPPGSPVIVTQIEGNRVVVGLHGPTV